MINLLKSMWPGWDLTHEPWISNQTHYSRLVALQGPAPCNLDTNEPSLTAIIADRSSHDVAHVK